MDKWRLNECITRDSTEEQRLYQTLCKPNKPYCVLHLEGSDHSAEFDTGCIPQEYEQILITANHTQSIFNWLTILENSEVIVCVDSVIANMVDQMGIQKRVESYLIPRSHIQLTPVLNGPWHTVEPNSATQQRIRLFQ